ncbi:metallophosphoesterase family protein [Lucifera butyrica]|uniref:metallophosphoesterase family protein n=1 Tax=Lucifera butyrica TaxID=1351585 RepID=UPI001A9FD245|nr:metallophosphoesterase [Lucifera butyrica]
MTLHERSEKLLKSKIRNLHRQEFRFVFMGDSRGRGPADGCFTMAGEFELVLEQTLKLKPLFIVHGGDTVFTGEVQYLAHFVRYVEKHVPDIPMFVAIGNHDELFLNQSNVENFEATIGKVHWKIDIPKFDFRCFSLNNIISPSNSIYGFTDLELDYLGHQLEISPRNTIVAMHAQPSIGRWSTLDGFPVDTPESQRFFQLIEQFRHKVKKVLVSHVHAYDEQFISLSPTGELIVGIGTDYVLTGGAGAPLDTSIPLIYNSYNFVQFFVNRHGVSSPDLHRVFGLPKKPCV